ncbi:MAG: glycosyltransferase [Clostridia bacterium]|nr:glycosyltransferase [Clostridia bacterium]
MNYQPKVTIIIPVYNGSNYLSQAIDAALFQTYKNCEIIVVNDGSTDNGESEKIALSYGDQIKYYHKENGGVSSALNFAFTKMTGEWFSWLSHDDLYKPEKIEKQILFINKLLEKDDSINLDKITIRCATESIDKEGKTIRLPDYSGVKEHEKPIETIINNVFNYRLSGCAFLLPSSCVKNVGGFDEKIRTVSDVEYWYRLLFAGYEFYCMKEDRLVKNRSHKQQVGKTKVNLFDKELNDLHIQIADNLAKMNIDNIGKIIVKFYKGLKYRHMKQAFKYVKKTYLRKYTNWVQYYFTLPLSCGLKWFIGALRNIARKVYRKIKVK